MQFPKFDRYVCEGDSVSLDVGGFTLTARVYRDDCGETFIWPSDDNEEE